METAATSPTATPGAAPARPESAQSLNARKVAEEFEAFFISTLLETMSSGIEVDPAFGGGHGEQVFRSMLNDEYARTFSRAGGIGVADAVYREMMRLQEVP